MKLTVWSWLSASKGFEICAMRETVDYDQVLQACGASESYTGPVRGNQTAQGRTILRHKVIDTEPHFTNL